MPPNLPPKTNANPLARILSFIHRFEDTLLAALLIVMIVLAAAQILLRNVFDIGLVWADPLLRIMVLWLSLMGALVASRENKHITIDVLTRLMSAQARYITHIFTSLFTVVVTAIIAYHAGRFVIMEYELQNEVLFGVSAWVFEAIIPIAFALIAVRYSVHFIQHIQAMMQSRERHE